MGILYFLDYFLTPITSATVISVHAKAHYGRAKITQWWECSPPRKWGLGSNTGIDTITWVALCSLHWNIIFSRLFNTYYFCNSYFCTCESALFAPRDFSPGALVFPFPFSLNISRFQFNHEWQTKNQNVDVPPLNHYLFGMVRLNLRKAYLALLSYLCTCMSSVQRM